MATSPPQAKFSKTGRPSVSKVVKSKRLCPFPNDDGLAVRQFPPFYKTMLESQMECVLVLFTLSIPIRHALGIPPLTQFDNNIRMLVIILHFILDSWRVQLGPIYVSLLFFSGRENSVLYDVIVVLLIIVSAFWCYVMPVNVVPLQPRGRFAVATVLDHIHTPVPKTATSTTSKVDPVIGEEPRPLEVMVQVFMPIDKSSVRKVPYTPIFCSDRSNGFAAGAPYTPPIMQRLAFRRTLAVTGAVGIIVGQMAKYDWPTITSQAELLFNALLEEFWIWAVHSSIISGEAGGGDGGGGGGGGSGGVADKVQGLDTPMKGVIAVAVMLMFTLSADIKEMRSRWLFRALYLPHGDVHATHLGRANGMNQIWFQPLKRMRSPAFDGAYLSGGKPVFPLTKEGGKLPVVLLFHGIKANPSTYSTYATELASHGYVVIAMESNCAAASACVLPLGNDTAAVKITPYDHPPADDDPAAFPFRAGQLERRMREVSLLMDHLDLLDTNRHAQTDGNSATTTNGRGTTSNKNKGAKKASSSSAGSGNGRKMVSDFQGMAAMGCNGQTLDLECIGLVGHSFGGATVLRIAQLSETRGYVMHPKRLKIVVSLDPWFFPLPRDNSPGTPDDRYTAALQDFKMTSPLMLLSNKAWQWQKNLDREEAWMKAAEQSMNDGRSKLCLRMQLLGSAHCNMSDLGLYSPLIARKSGMIGKVDPITFLDMTSELVLAALYAFLEQQPDTSQRRWVNLLTGQALPASVADVTHARGKSPPFPPN